jgi:hypothetical protein
MFNMETCKQIRQIVANHGPENMRDAFNGILECWKEDNKEDLAFHEDAYFAFRQIWNIIYPSGVDEKGKDFNSAIS